MMNYDDAGGRLQFNPAIITSTTNVEHGRTTTMSHELAPQLFLERMTAQEQLHRQAQVNFRENAEYSLFLTESSQQRFDPNSMVAGLFQNESFNPQLVTPATTTTSYLQLPIWIMIVGGIFFFGILNFLGMTLARKLARTLYQKRGVEKNG